MKIEELIEGLINIKDKQDDRGGFVCGDFQDDHRDADELLLEYIDNEEVTNAFDEIDKWYA